MDSPTGSLCSVFDLLKRAAGKFDIHCHPVTHVDKFIAKFKPASFFFLIYRPLMDRNKELANLVPLKYTLPIGVEKG